MKYFDICTKRTWEKDGEQKVSWLKAGTMRVNDEGKQFIELAMFPTTPFYVFEQKDKAKGDPFQAAPRKAPMRQDPEAIAWEE